MELNWKRAGKLALIAAAYFAAHELAFLFPDSPPVLVTIWPAGGIGLAAFLLGSRRDRAPICAVLFVSGLLADLIAGRSFLASAGFMIANVLESALCSWAIVSIGGEEVRFDHILQIGALVASAVLINAATALVGAGAAALTAGGAFFPFWRSWWIADGLGILLIAPLIVVIRYSWKSHRHWRTAVEGVVFFAVWCFLSLHIFRTETFLGVQVPLYFLVVLLAWASIRLGMVGVTISVLALSIIAVSSPAIQSGPSALGGGVLSERLLRLEMFIGVVAVTGYLLAAAYEEKKAATMKLRAAELRLEKAQEVAHVGSWEWNPVSNQISLSREAHRILQLSRETFDGDMTHLILQAIHPDDRSKAAEDARRLLHERHEPWEARIVRPDRSVRVVQLQAGDVLKDHHGSPLSLVGTIADVTELRRAEEDLRASERKYHGLFNSTRAAVIVLRDDGRIVDLNPAARQLTGLADSSDAAVESIGRTFISPEDRATILCRLAHEESIDNVELTLTKVNGSNQRVVVLLNAVKLDAPTGGQNVMITMTDITERKKVEESLRSSENKFSRAFLAGPAATVITRLIDDTFVDVSETFLRSMGFQRDEIMGRTIDELGIWTDAGEKKTFRESLVSNGVVRDFEATFRKRSRETFSVSLSSTLLEIDKDLCGMTYMTDLTARKRAEHRRLDIERRMLAVQKAESLGTLAGGIAHNFNNLLTVILGYAELLRDKITEDFPFRNVIDEIVRAGYRARDLVKDLLSVGRREILEMTPHDLNAIVAGCGSILRQALRENVTIEYRLSAIPLPILADAGRIEQVLLNLALNAQDAIAKGGKLTIETTQVYIDPWQGGNSDDLPHGRCAQLSISDTGAGIAPEVLPKVFDPFFTTKGQGRGTGLGLSTVYGIVKQHGGDIEVESCPGKGTTFRMYFPIADAGQAGVEGRTPRPITPGNETILVVEDIEPVRRLVCRQLVESGYTIMDAADGASALRIARAHSGRIDLLLTDVVMEGMTGIELYHQLLQEMPGIRVLYMSGYQQDIVSEHGVDGGGEMIQKPFTRRALSERVRRVLEREQRENCSREEHGD